jgi:hypothetical protein
MPFWPSTKLNVTVAQSADVTEASVTTPVDITGLTVDLPRAGTYFVMAVLPATATDGTSRTAGFGVSFSGSTTLLSLTGVYDSTTATAGSAVGSRTQTTSGTLGSFAARTDTAWRWIVTGVIKVSTPGTLKMQFSRSAASITHTTGVMTVREA